MVAHIANAGAGIPFKEVSFRALRGMCALWAQAQAQESEHWV